MRKLIFLLLVFASVVANAQTRSRFEQEVSVGGSVGLNMSQVRFLHNDLMNSNQLGELGWTKGVTAGVSMRYIAQKHFGVQLEVNYAQCGWYEKYENKGGGSVFVNGVDLTGKVIEQDLSYINVPLLAHIYFGNDFRFFVNFGPKIGFLIDEGDKCDDPDIKGALIENDPRVRKDIEESKFDYSLCAGCGFEVNLGKVKTLAEFRWMYGLQDVYPHERDDAFQRSNNQNLAFTLCVFLPVAKFHSN